MACGSEGFQLYLCANVSVAISNGGPPGPPCRPGGAQQHCALSDGEAGSVDST